jgi:hypothetical protein
MYSISKQQYDIAKKLGVHIFPSDKPKYKIDVYDNEHVYSIGDIRYNDYFTYLQRNGKTFADNRRRLYLIRHKKELSSIGRGWWSAKLLWAF